MTLEGHPEAGRIRFEVHPLDGRPDALRFEIHSLARSRDGLVAFAYDTWGAAGSMQEATWVEFCQRVGEAQRGPGAGPGRGRNHPPRPGWPPASRWPMNKLSASAAGSTGARLGAVPRPARHLRPRPGQLRLRARPHEYTSATGWRLDDYATDLPAEAPGPPAGAARLRRRRM